MILGEIAMLLGELQGFEWKKLSVERLFKSKW